MQKTAFKIYIFLSFILFVLHYSAHAQYYNLGQDPASIRWKQLNTAHFCIIFPAEDEAESKRLAFLLESAAGPVSAGLNFNASKTNVILHSRSTLSNGVVSWAPQRMELFPCPPQSNYPQEWLEQLALHEYRHIIQISSMNRGFTHGLNILLGQQASSLILGLFIPPWFMEGDAVSTETALSRTGRGSAPDFEALLRSQLLEKGKFSYDKAVFGSYHDRVADHYTLGYHIVAYGRTHYGNRLWQNALEQTARRPYRITPFSHGIKQISGLSKVGLYKKTMNSLDSLWAVQDNRNEILHMKILQPANVIPWSDYQFPAMMDHGVVFSLRKSKEDIPRFVSFLPGGKEQILFTPGSLEDDIVYCRNNKIIWTEAIPDIRWENRSFSRIKIYDLAKNKLKIIGKKSRYFAACPSDDFSKIVVSETTEKGLNFLIVLNTADGKEICKFQQAENEQFLTPIFNSDGNTILAICLGLQGKSIVEIDLKNNKFHKLFSAGFVDISKAVYHNKNILFIGAFNGINCIYSLDTTHAKISQLMPSRFGAKDINFSGNDSIIYSDFTYTGFRTAITSIESKISQKNLSQIPHFNTDLDSLLRRQEHPVLFNDKKLQDSILNIKTSPYSKAGHLFHFHSWSPVYLTSTDMRADPGIQLISQNMLSTSVMSLGVVYNPIEMTTRFKSTYSYLGWFPIFDLSYEDGLRASMNGGKRFTYKETNLGLQISLPLNLSRNKYLRRIQPYIGATWENIQHTSSSPDRLFKGAIDILNAGFSSYNILRYTEKDIFPRWGQTLRYQSRQTPWGDLSVGNIFALNGNFFFPGLFRHQSFRLTLAYQQKGSGDQYFSDLIVLPRGFTDFTKAHFFSSSLDYSLPILYPDLSLPGFTYIKRVKAALFADYAYQKAVPDENFYSTGIELTADLYLFRLYAPMELGCRSTYITQKKELKFEFLWSIGFGSYGGKQELRNFDKK